MKNTNANTLVIFGASDHEEQLAREIAKAAGCMVGTACVTVDGVQRKVHAGNAYIADSFVLDTKEELVERIILFECKIKEGTILDFMVEPEICDHHKPGDPGYDKGPDEYWDGSSLGQLVGGVLKMTHKEAAELIGVHWHQVLMTAAGDHCPKDAYAGHCWAIDPEEFGMFRRTQIWSFECERQGLDDSFSGKLEKYALVGEIYDHIQAAARLLETGSKVNGIVDLRDKGFIPQLPEAALMTGAAYMAKIDEVDRERQPTGNKKIVLGGHTDETQVKIFMAWAENLVNRIGEPYGNPTRGYAGVVVHGGRPWCPTCKAEIATFSTCACPECGVPYPPESQIG